MVYEDGKCGITGSKAPPRFIHCRLHTGKDCYTKFLEPRAFRGCGHFPTDDQLSGWDITTFDALQQAGNGIRAVLFVMLKAVLNFRRVRACHS